ncbi:hypothetical protein NDA03_25740 [Trichocoleus sp. Lan]|uniref:hypothetical protein n=1 Tax=Trichocoleus sp. Lan TaxID=2933927 RepID=UPI0032977958
MQEPQTTEELVRILSQERRACGKGQRVYVPVEGAEEALKEADQLTQFLGIEGLSSIAAYHDFRDLIQEYQVKHQISGIIWKQVALGDRALTVPEVDNQLVCLPSDMEILKAHKQQVLDFWVEYVTSNDLDIWVEVSVKGGGETIIRKTLSDVEQFAAKSDWAHTYNRSHIANSSEIEVLIELGWGDPNLAGYASHPECSSEFFHAVEKGAWDWDEEEE